MQEGSECEILVGFQYSMLIKKHRDRSPANARPAGAQVRLSELAAWEVKTHVRLW